MYYRDQYGNVAEYSAEGSEMYSNSIHPGGRGYHPLTRENFELNDFKTWFEKYKMWILYAILAIVMLVIFMKLYKNNNKRPVAQSSTFY
jgi:hypothetical protein